MDVMTEVEQWKALLILRRVVTHPHGADEVLRHLLEPDDGLQARVRRIIAGLLLFLKRLRGLAAMQHAVFDGPCGVLAHFPKISVDGCAVESVLIHEFEALEELRLIRGISSP